MAKAGRKLEPGDILWVDRGLYRHCGIYEGDGNVIHFAAPEGSEINMENAVIHRTTLEHFKEGCPVKVIGIKGGFSAEETIRRARSRLGERGYDFTANNCDHFAVWCKTGQHRSLQVEGIKATLNAIGKVSVEMNPKIGGSVKAAVDLVLQIHDIVETIKAPNSTKRPEISRKK